MQASSLIARIGRCVSVRDWLWWRLPLTVKTYVGAVPVASAAVIGVTGLGTRWYDPDLARFSLLMCCGVASVASTPRILYTYPGVTRDFSSVWVLPAAILLPPFYAAIAPIPFTVALNLFVHRGVLHRAVFTAAAQSVSYAAASVIFRWFPASFAGGEVGHGFHAFTWCLAVATCEVVGGRMQHFLIVGAVKLSNPKMQVLKMELERSSLQALFVEIDLAILITLTVALSPALVLIAVPTALLVRRFMVFPILEARSRTDAKTGLLNISTWEAEAHAELSRAIRLREPLSLALVDIDHFKNVNDTYGHLVGDKVIKAVADSLTSHLRDYDRAGRFGGEEFVLLLAKTTEHDVCKVAERLRGQVADLAVPVDDGLDAEVVRVTISVGVTGLAQGAKCELPDLLAAADSALYHAKQSGRNCVALAALQQNRGRESLSTAAPISTAHGTFSRGGVSALNRHDVELVRADSSTVSLCPKEPFSRVSLRHITDSCWLS